MRYPQCSFAQSECLLRPLPLYVFVYSFFSKEQNPCELKSEGIVLNELDNDVFANILFDNRSMFVIILKKHEESSRLRGTPEKVCTCIKTLYI